MRTWTAPTFDGNRPRSSAATMQNDTLGWRPSPRASPFDRKGRGPCTMVVGRTSSAPTRRNLRFSVKAASKLRGKLKAQFALCEEFKIPIEGEVERNWQMESIATLHYTLEGLALLLRSRKLLRAMENLFRITFVLKLCSIGWKLFSRKVQVLHTFQKENFPFK